MCHLFSIITQTDGYESKPVPEPAAPPETLWEEWRTLWIVSIAVAGTLCCILICCKLRRNPKQNQTDQWSTTYFNPIIEDEYQNGTAELKVRCSSCGSLSPSTTGICPSCDRTSIPRTATQMKLMSDKGGKHVFMKNLKSMFV